jgi:hypothetical protein
MAPASPTPRTNDEAHFDVYVQEVAPALAAAV